MCALIPSTLEQIGHCLMLIGKTVVALFVAAFAAIAFNCLPYYQQNLYSPLLPIAVRPRLVLDAVRFVSNVLVAGLSDIEMF